MTQTTIKRQVTLLVKGLLQKHAIDHLQLEIELVEGVWGFITEVRKGRDAATVRAEILAALKANEAQVTKDAELESRIFKALGLYVNEQWYKSDVIAFLHKREAEGQTVEEFAEACKADPFTMPKFYEIAKNPEYLRTVWGMAFVNKPPKNQEPIRRAFYG